MGYKYLLFDLDGTITESAEGIINSVYYALTKAGMKVEDKNELYKFIGPPFHVSLSEYFNFNEEQVQETMGYYRERFSTIGIYENKLYDGIDTLLKELHENGKTIVLATSKPEIFAKRILDYFNITQYFTFVAGSNLDYTRAKKAEVIEYAMQSAGITDKDETIMIGDRLHDIEGAKAHGIKCIGVSYGYGSHEELEKYGADFVADTMDDIRRIVL